jgi:DNA-binding transcriptional MerR regulator
MTMTTTTTYAPHEVADRTGFSLDTLRYYERIGLLEDVGRTGGGRRQYREEHIAWLRILHCLRRTGMPVREMRRYAELARDGSATEEERLSILEGHRVAVLAEIDELRRALTVIDEKIDYYRGGR